MERVERLGFWTKEATLKMAYVFGSEGAQKSWIKENDS
jgi:hypothetical protein